MALAHSLTPSSAHQLGNSIGVLRQYYNLGVRYVTLAHFCHNAFADSSGFEVPIEPLHGGLRYAKAFVFVLSSDAQERCHI
jgi:membrane dipeptidase